MRKCCGYYCAMIALIAIFFYGVIIAMEVRKNQFVIWKLQYPEGGEALDAYKGKTAEFVAAEMNAEADNKVTALIIAIGVNYTHCLIMHLVERALHNWVHGTGQNGRQEGSELGPCIGTEVRSGRGVQGDVSIIRVNKAIKLSNNIYSLKYLYLQNNKEHYITQQTHSQYTDTVQCRSSTPTCFHTS